MDAQKKIPFRLPKRMETEPGQLRRVGFEIEYTGLDLFHTAGIISQLFGGRVEQVSTFMARVVGTRFGTYTVEIDTGLLKDQRYESLLAKLGIQLHADFKNDLEPLLLQMAETIIPYEIVTPPIPLDQLAVLEDLRIKLYEAQARGTGHSLVYAFGLHINPELPSLDAATILGFLRAFFLLEPWIREERSVDLARRLTPFINDFPKTYVLEVLDPSYAPDRDTLIADYLAANPTRNRSLDLIPLFAFFQKDLVLDKVRQKEAVKPRPTLHYRLPDCRIDDPSWTIAQEWNAWIIVEELADNPDMIERMSRKYLERSSLFSLGQQDWIEQIRKWGF